MGAPLDKPASRGKPGRPPGKKDSVKRTRGRKPRSNLAQTKSLIDGACRVSKNGPVDVLNALKDIRVQWGDLESMALAFLTRGLELLPTVARATDALICADRIMAILERRTDMQSAAREVLQTHGISVSFSTAEELGIVPKKEEN
jgi:hypothetical protein